MKTSFSKTSENVCIVTWKRNSDKMKKLIVVQLLKEGESKSIIYDIIKSKNLDFAILDVMKVVDLGKYSTKIVRLNLKS